jgi:hypothetical protein
MRIETDLMGALAIGVACVMFLVPLLCYLCSRMATLGRLDALKIHRNVIARNNERDDL